MKNRVVERTVLKAADDPKPFPKGIVDLTVTNQSN